MDIHISGQGFDIGESLKTHITEDLQKDVFKYFQHAVSAKVHISQEAKHKIFHVDILVNEGVSHGPIIKSSASDFDPYIAANDAIEKISKKLRRYKSKLKDNKIHKKSNIKSQLLSRFNDEQEPQAKIIEEQTMTLKHLVIEDAIRHLEFMSLPALIFINAETHKLNIIYTKEDGHIILVDTTQVVSEG